MTIDIQLENGKAILKAFNAYEMDISINFDSQLQPFPKVEKWLNRDLRDNELIICFKIPSGRYDSAPIFAAISAINDSLNELAEWEVPAKKPKIIREDRLKAAIVLRFSKPLEEMPLINAEELIEMAGSKFMKYYESSPDIRWQNAEHPRASRRTETEPVR